MEWDNDLIDRLNLYGARVILFVHDIDPLQYESNYYLMDKFIGICNKCKMLIVPSEKMYRCLVEHGLKVKKYAVQNMWDFKMIFNYTNLRLKEKYILLEKRQDFLL